MHIYTGLNLEVWSKIAGLVIEGAGEREGKRKGVGIKCHVISNGKLGMGQLFLPHCWKGQSHRSG
jgi:hypothetical protein